jgi:mannose-1-phosphate guanylyltransferase
MQAYSALVLAGGRGERFWPWSRPERPKQLLPLDRGRSLLEATLSRLEGLVAPERTWILTSRHLVPAVRALAPEGAHVVGEPVGRNTAPAVALGALLARAAGASHAMAVLPADHWIEPAERFRETARRALALADGEPLLVTIGVPPDRPETGLGYIERGAPLGPGAYRVASFREKPDRATAEAFLAAGRYYWNSGMFFWRPQVLWEAVQAHRPAVASPLRRFESKLPAARLEAELDAAFGEVEAISIDFAVMEKATNIAVVEAEFAWDDMGSWNAWARRQPSDAQGNVVVGQALVVDSRRCIVVTESSSLAVLGAEDLIVVQRDGATLVCPRSRSEEVRRVAERAGGERFE